MHAVQLLTTVTFTWPESGRRVVHGLVHHTNLIPGMPGADTRDGSPIHRAYQSARRHAGGTGEPRLRRGLGAGVFQERGGETKPTSLPSNPTHTPPARICSIVQVSMARCAGAESSDARLPQNAQPCSSAQKMLQKTGCAPARPAIPLKHYVCVRGRGRGAVGEDGRARARDGTNAHRNRPSCFHPV